MSSLRARADASVPILVLDDRPASQLAWGGILTAPIYELVYVGGGAEALEALRQRDFALVLIDVEASAASGVQTASEMRRIAAPAERDAPIIFVTAPGQCVALPDAHAGGAVDYLRKPLDGDAVRSKVEVFAEFYRSRERLRRRLEIAVRAREEQLAVVAHDLRNPLNAVLLAASQVKNLSAGLPAAERVARAAQSIVKAVGRMDRLVGNLLDVAKLDAGQALPLDIERQDVAKIVLSVVEGNEALARSRRLTLTADAPDSTVVPCDGERLEQLLSNLVDNAIKFTREGGTIQVRSRRTQDGAAISVSDTGIGIGEEHMRHMFEPYWQQDAQPKRGAGLGLAIARAIVDAHGGRIWAETAPGIGTTFHVTLPSETPTPAGKDPR